MSGDILRRAPIPCRAYDFVAHLCCGLMEGHDGPHIAAAYFANTLRRFRFMRTDGTYAGQEYPR